MLVCTPVLMLIFQELGLFSEYKGTLIDLLELLAYNMIYPTVSD